MKRPLQSYPDALAEHLEHVKCERQDYYVRMQLCETYNSLMNRAHDDLSKDSAKCHHLPENCSKNVPFDKTLN